MCRRYCRIDLILLLLSCLHIIGPGYVSSEELKCSSLIPLLVVGARVERGEDWQWGNQDGTPPQPGTILAKESEGWFNVKWDNGTTNRYRMGYQNSCDLKLVPAESTVSTTSSTTPVTTNYSPTVTTPRPESGTSTTPLSPTCCQCTCSKEMSASQAKTEAETAELVGKLSLEAATVSLETAKASASAQRANLVLEAEIKKLELAIARVALEAAQSSAKSEETDKMLDAEMKKLALEAAKYSVRVAEAKAREAENVAEASRVAVEAAKSTARAEESWATNAAEELTFERDRRNKAAMFIDNEL